VIDLDVSYRQSVGKPSGFFLQHPNTQ